VKHFAWHLGFRLEGPIQLGHGIGKIPELWIREGNGRATHQQAVAGDIPFLDPIRTDFSPDEMARLDRRLGKGGRLDDGLRRVGLPARAIGLALFGEHSSQPGHVHLSRALNGTKHGASNATARGLGWRPHYPIWRGGFTMVLT
jgi:hypothetical protein